MTKSPEFNAPGSVPKGELGEVVQENIEPTKNRPETSVPEWRLWQTKLEKTANGKTRETIVKSPDGANIPINDGERFVINRLENGDYEAVAVDKDGNKRVLRESLASKKSKLEEKDKEDLELARESLGLEKEPIYDVERLNKITKACSERGANFGKEVNLEEEDKRQIEIVNSLVEGQINEVMEDDEEWKKFEELKSKLSSKGYLTRKTVVDGGENVHIHEKEGDQSKGESPIQLVVPSRVYNANFYKEIVRETRDIYLKPDAEKIRGYLVSGLGANLNQLKHFIKVIKERK